MYNSSKGLFYAYAKNINDDWSYRYLITFATRDVADTWYRAVTDSVASGYQRFAAVKRVSLQFYTHDPAGNIPDTITDPKVALALRGQMFFTLIHDRDARILSVIPVLNYSDHISGASFYIRSVAQPDTYWYIDTSKPRSFVVASREHRTRFTITIADKNRAPGTVIIGGDDVYITTVDGTNIGISNQQDILGHSANPFPLRFSSFNSDFHIIFFDPSSSLAAVARNPGKGESWELV
ncbi:hypothetical protein D9615_010418 [Tricholomella constricta]|uniref:Uncharacterized protein n=1 Tax=Tricholomella constricta TaxID=117010 RepID=A0A8H5GQW5_9AGAR|nr:hypothetical protein D9615_010418 [Tricholomella constricta]